MIVLDIVARILMMFGLIYTTSSNASLLNNFEIVATSVIALVVFKEVISKKLCYAIAPFIGVFFSVILLKEELSLRYLIALLIMIISSI